MAANVSDIQKMSVVDVLKLPQLKETFIHIYNTRRQSTGGAYFFDREMGFLKKLWGDNKWFKEAKPMEIYASVLKMAYYGLSIEPGPKALASIFPRGGVVYDPSAYGHLTLRLDSEVVWGINITLAMEGDDIYVVDGHVHHKKYLGSNKMTGVWARVFLDRSRTIYDDHYYSMDWIMSLKKNSTAATWTGGIDGQPMEGFVKAKALRHAITMYPVGVPKKKDASAEDELKAMAAADAAYAAAVGEIIQGNESYDDDPYEEVQDLDAKDIIGNIEVRDIQEDPDDLGPFTPPVHVQQQLAQQPKPPAPKAEVVQKAAPVTTPPPFDF